MNFMVKLRDLWKEFCTTTGVRGFGFMFRAGTLGEKLFWAVMIVICSGLTIMDVYDSVQLFLISPTSTRVFVSSNQSISLGSPTLCVDLDMSNFTYSRINLAEPKTVDQLLATFVGEDVMEFLRRNFEAVQLIRENNSDPMSLFNYNSTPLDETYENKRILPLLSLTAVMLSNIIRAEHYVNSSGLRADFAWGVPMNTREERSFGRNINRSTSASIRQVYNFYSMRKTSLSQLLSLVGALLCQIMDVRLSLSRHDGTVEKVFLRSVSPCHPSRISWLGMQPYDYNNVELLCMRLPSYYFNFSLSVEPTVITFRPQNIYSDLSDRLAYLDLSGFEVYNPRSQNILYVKPLRNRHVTVQLLGHYRLRNSSPYLCSNIPFSACSLNCRLEHITHYCGCLPLSVYNDSHSYDKPLCVELRPMTTSRQYNYEVFAGLSGAKCTNFTKFIHPDRHCYSSCVNECQYKIYSFTSYNLLDRDDLTTSVLLNVDPFVYPIFEEFPITGAKQFLGNLGGNLNFWLGASFLVLVHVVIFCIKLPFNLNLIQMPNLNPRSAVIYHVNSGVKL